MAASASSLQAHICMYIIIFVKEAKSIQFLGFFLPKFNIHFSFYHRNSKLHEKYSKSTEMNLQMLIFYRINVDFEFHNSHGIKSADRNISESVKNY